MKKLMVGLMLVVSIALTAQEKRDLPVPSSGNVTMTLEEYNKLVELAGKPVTKPESPPIPYAIRNADLKLRVTSDSVLGTVQCDGEVFAKSVVKVPLVGAPTVLDARQAGKPLPLEQESGMHVAFLSGPAEFSITLDTGIPLSIEAGRASFSMPVPAAGSAKLLLEIPGEHTNVKINPGLITRRSADNGKTVVEATLVPGQYAGIWWTTREIVTPTAPREVRFLSDVKTLVSLSEADLRLAVLGDITVVQGEPDQFEVDIPAGFEMTGVTGSSLESEEIKSGHLILKVNEVSKRSHQFLISLEKPISAVKTDIPFLAFKGAQRETGEVLVEGEGTMELSATEKGALKRMDLKEVNTYLRSLAQHSLHAAFRYHRQQGESPELNLEWNRFPDGSVLAAIAERAVVTTLVTSEGRSLTEVKLVVKNQAQPFLKVGLPTGASILTADVAGEKVKPVQGADGSRVPLLRTGFRPSGDYMVTFVFMHAGVPFSKKGDSDLSLPKMDIPINLLQWEVFLPAMYKVKDFGGDAMSTNLVQPISQIVAELSEEDKAAILEQLPRGNLEGTVVDFTKAVLPGVTVTVTHMDTGIAFSAVTNPAGRWIVSNVPVGNLNITAELKGFRTQTLTGIFYDPYRPHTYNFTLDVAAIEEVIEVRVDREEGWSDSSPAPTVYKPKKEVKKPVEAPSTANVLNLQKRVAGVLPIQVDVPRTGVSYNFVRPLVLDEETRVTFKYKSK